MIPFSALIVFIIILFFYYQKKAGRITPTSMLLLFYLLVAIAGLFSLNSYEYKADITIAASLYFVFIFVIYLKPLMGKKSIVEKGFEINNTSIFRCIIGLYLILALILVIYNLTVIKQILVDGNWGQLKQLAYDGKLDVSQATLIKLARVYVGSLWSAVMLFGFYVVKEESTPLLKGVFYILAGLIPAFVTNLLYAYRGGIGIQILLMVCCFFLMKKWYGRRRKRQFYIVFFIILSLLASVILVITISRFGEGEAVGSLLSYLGQSMLNYNGGVFGKIQAYAHGKYFLGPYLNNSIEQVCNDSLYGISSNNGSNLHTFIGNIVLDFGFIGGVIFSIMVISVVDILINNRNAYDFADSALLMFYLDFMFTGAFHSPFGYAKNCVYFFVLYFVFKIFNQRIVIRDENENYRMLS